MKVLVIGLGGIGQRHVRNLRSILGSDVEILAYRVRRLSHVVTPALQSDPGRDVEKEYDIQVFDTLDAALAEDPQVAFVCNPTSLHILTATACVQAGCDVFLEKPVSDTMDGVYQLLAAARDRHRVVMVGYQLRFHPCLQALQEIVCSGSLGRIVSVRATVGEYLPGWHPYEDYRRTYAARADLGGGVIVSQIHEFDYLYALFGPPQRVFALGGHSSRLEIDVEDIASTLMDFHPEGRLVPVHLHQDYLQRPASRGCEVIGDEGKAIMDLTGPSLTRYGNDGKVTSAFHWEKFDRNQLFLDQIKHFLDCVETRRKPLVDLSDGIWSLRMALAARESIVKGSIVDLQVKDVSELVAHANSTS